MPSSACCPAPSATSAHRSTSPSATPDLLEAPAYTKPVEFRGMKVPEVLLSGHHAEIAKWKQPEALARTRANRPDLLDE